MNNSADKAELPGPDLCSKVYKFSWIIYHFLTFVQELPSTVFSTFNKSLLIVTPQGTVGLERGIYWNKRTILVIWGNTQRFNVKILINRKL